MKARGSPAFALAVVGACLAHLLLVALAGPGFMSSDDEVYTRLAHDMSAGEFHLVPEHRANRLGLIAPTALAYGVAGVGRWSTVAWPLLCSLAGVVVLALVARRLAGDTAGALAAFLLAPLTLVVNGSAFLIPDGPVAVQMFAAAACLWVARESRGRRAAAWGTASALLVAVGVMTKLTTLWTAPFFAALFALDLAARRNRAVWSAFVATGIVTAIAFFVSYAAATGDALYRVHAVDHMHNDTHWAYENAGAGELLSRVTYEPALMLVRSLPELTLLLGLATAAALGARGSAARRSVLFWSAYAVVVIAGFWAGTTSWSRLAPLPLLPRMLAPAAAPLALLAACALTTERVRRALLAPVVVVPAGAAAVVVADGRLLVAGLYAAAAGASLLALRGSGGLRKVGVLAVLALPVAMCGYSVARQGAGESRAMREERAFVAALPANVDAGATVLTDRRSERTFRFYRAYDDARPAVLSWDGTEDRPVGAAPTYVYWHAARVEWRGGRAAPPDWLAAAVPGGEVVWESGDVRLVRLAP